ncbi:MAG TPA: hypothetical protein VFF59_04420, partial [Anaerolineae bacterium]|nr:hypothetical protein [Anaerolineae bacterium]
VVTIPGGAAAGTIDTANVKVTSHGNPATFANATLTTTVTSTLRGVSVAPAAAAQAGLPGTIVTYALTVTNTGSASDTFTVTVSGNAFVTSAPATVGPLAAGASTTFNVVVTIPVGAVAGTLDSATVTVKSQGDDTTSASANLTTSVWFSVYLPLVLK